MNMENVSMTLQGADHPEKPGHVGAFLQEFKSQLPEVPRGWIHLKIKSVVSRNRHQIVAIFTKKLLWH
jgi:hypothetical protein